MLLVEEIYWLCWICGKQNSGVEVVGVFILGVKPPGMGTKLQFKIYTALLLSEPRRTGDRMMFILYVVITVAALRSLFITAAAMFPSSSIPST